MQENPGKRKKAWKNKEILEKVPCGATLPPWACFGRSWALLGRSWVLLGRSWALLGRSWQPLGRFLAAPWTQLEKLSRGMAGNGFNLAAKIHPSWLQNPLEIHFKKQTDFGTIFSYCFDVFHRFPLQSKNKRFCIT